MEYSVLGLKENADFEEVRKALKYIRKKHHPDSNRSATSKELELMKHIVFLAEEAFHRIESKERVKKSVQSMPSFQPFQSPIPFFDRMFNSVHDVNPSPFHLNNVHTETYSYSNINGQVRESATVNGKELNKEELQQKRKNYQSLVK